MTISNICKMELQDEIYNHNKIYKYYPQFHIIYNDQPS